MNTLFCLSRKSDYVAPDCNPIHVRIQNIVCTSYESSSNIANATEEDLGTL